MWVTTTGEKKELEKKSVKETVENELSIGHRYEQGDTHAMHFAHAGACVQRGSKSEDQSVGQFLPPGFCFKDLWFFICFSIPAGSSSSSDLISLTDLRRVVDFQFFQLFCHEDGSETVQDLHPPNQSMNEFWTLSSKEDQLLVNPKFETYKKIPRP